MSYFLYSETAFHHEGDLDYLKKLITLSADLGINGVKFQVLTNADYLFAKKHSTYEVLSNMVFSEDQWIEAFELCKNLDIDIIFMPINPKALALANRYADNISYLDLHSISFNDQAILNEIKATKIPVILGIGGRTIEEIKEKQEFLGEQLQVLMVGFQAFPSQLEDIKLKKIALLKKLYPTLKIGYADHSSFNNADKVRSNFWAYTLGARVFEKHLTLNEGLKRVDYEAAVGKSTFQKIITGLQYLDEKVLSHAEKTLMAFTPAELNYRNRERVAVATVELKVGTILDESHFSFKMIDKQGGLAKKELLIGKTITQNIVREDIIRNEDLMQ